MRNDYEVKDDGRIYIYLQKRNGIQYGTTISLASLVKLSDVDDTLYLDFDSRKRPRVRFAKTGILLHRYLTNCPEGKVVDHINGQPSMNELTNLRICTRAENNQNVQLNRGKSKYRGVSQTNTGKWEARHSLNGQTYYLGTFDTEEAAAQAAKQWRQDNMPFSVA